MLSKLKVDSKVVNRVVRVNAARANRVVSRVAKAASRAAMAASKAARAASKGAGLDNSPAKWIQQNARRADNLERIRIS